MTAVAPAGAALDAIQSDPVAFCRTVLKFEPWSKQREILESVRDHRRTAVRSAHGVGKTSVAARTALWFLAANPRSTVITTAPTWSQVTQQLWREIAVGYQSAGSFFGGRLSDTKLDLGANWFAIGLSTDRPERFQGYHSEHLLLICDEASGIDERIFESAEGFLTSPNSRVLLIGNPTKVSGQFHRAFHSERAMWNTIAVSAFDSPAFTGEEVSDDVQRRLVSPEWIDGYRKKTGESGPLWECRVCGQFPSEADDTLFSLADIEAAQQRKVEPGLPLVVACDVARFGSDESVIVLRRGDHVRVAQTYNGRDTMQTAGAILRVAREAAALEGHRPMIVIDDAGVGGGVTDRLRETSEYPIVAFNAAMSAYASRDYPNRRSEVWFAFAEQLAGIDLDDDEQLAADLLAPRYSIDSAARRVVEPKSMTKSKLGRSPDRADAVLMAFGIGDGRTSHASVGGTTHGDISSAFRSDANPTGGADLSDLIDRSSGEVTF